MKKAVRHKSLSYKLMKIFLFPTNLLHYGYYSIVVGHT